MIELVRETEEIKEDLRILRQILERIVAVGEVVEVNPQTHRVRVKLKGRQGVITDFLPVLVPMSYKDRVYALPKVGDTVLCIFLPYGIEDGFVLGSFYTINDGKPANDENIHVTEFEDGTRIEYDKGTGKLTVENPKELVIRIQNTSNLTSPTVTIEGDVTVQGNLFVSGDIQSIGQTTAQGGLKTSPSGQTIFVDDLVTKYNSHTHTDSSGSSTSTPDQLLP